MAANTDAILAGKYPAKTHARAVAKYMKKTSGVIYLEGQKTTFNEDNDGEAHFRQRRYFFYLSGCNVPDCSLAYDISEDKLTLFVPPVDPESVIWSGLPISREESLAQFDIDDCRTTSDVNATLAGAKSKDTIFAIATQVSDNVTFLPFDEKDFELVKNAIEECRVLKDDYEVALIRRANEISTIAHTACLERVKNAKNERELEAVFIERCIANGIRDQAYHGIFASGTAGSTLHYVRNDQPLAGKLNVLLDAGGELDCYASDITRCFPINGEFSKESREIYDVVLKMQEVCIAMLKAGVHWDDVHLQAHKTAIEGLLKIGILQGDKEEILKNRTSVAFFPHGVGHYLGMDTHDTGGHPDYATKDTLFKYLRVRLPLPAKSVVTVEPGIYFCKFIIDPYLRDPVHAPYINLEVLDKYWEVGGIRIEDNILITENGYDNLTTAIKDVNEIERIVSSA